MKTPRTVSTSLLSRAAATVFCLVSAASAQEIQTNWVAYNDHRPGPLTPPHVPTPSSWGTATNVTTYNMGAPADTTGFLVDFLTGQQLPVQVSFTRTGSPDDFGTVTKPVPTNTPMARLFLGICDLAVDGLVGVRAAPPNTSESFVTLTITGLNPDKRYTFRGSVTRNGNYLTRWTVAKINAAGWIDAHIAGAGGPGVLTSNQYPANLVAGEAAFNSGHNGEGAVVGWDFIEPYPDGSFYITCKQYTGPIPVGAGVADGPYGYAFGAMLLAEVEASMPSITSHPVPETVVEESRPFSLSVTASGTPLLYQWYKEGVGPIAGATFPTYAVAAAALSDSGNYYAVVYNPLGSVTSTVARVTVLPDTNAPTLAAVFAYPTFDFDSRSAQQDRVIVEFSEPMDPGTINDSAVYTLTDAQGDPVDVQIDLIVTNRNQTVILTTAPLADDAAYTLTVDANVTDLFGNPLGANNVAQFRSWVSGPGNGLLFEAFEAGAGVDVSTLTSSTNYPDNPFLREVMPIFDTRAVFPDDTREQYGARIRGVFIPPFSGQWVFFLRTYDRGVVFFNPNGLDASGAVEIVRESTGNEPRYWNKFISSPFSLRAGQPYYIESLHKADAGTDVLKVAARPAGTGYPEPVDNPVSELDRKALAGAFVAGLLAPRDLGGALTLVQDLADVTTEEYNDVTFSVEVNNPSGLPLLYQWFRDDQPVGTRPTYNLLPALADNGAEFQVRVAKIGSTVLSRRVRLTVVPDTTPPSVQQVISPATNLAMVFVVFSERMDPNSGVQDVVNYSLLPDGLPSVRAATLGPDGRTVTVEFDTALVAGQLYTLGIETGSDLSNNTMESTNRTFRAGGELPELAIALAGSQAVISWPAPSEGFVLEQADAIVIPVSSMIWTPVGITPTVVDGRNTVTVPVSAGSRIFRLRR